MKNRCYPKYQYVLSFVLAAVLLMFALGPIVIKTDDKLYIKIIWSSVMFAFSIFSIIYALILMQYYVIEDGKIIVKSVFGPIVSLELSNCFLQIQNLLTDGRSVKRYKLWLCIYLKGNSSPIFTKGNCNSKKHKRIQIIYSEKNSAILSQYIQGSIKQHLVVKWIFHKVGL